MVVTLARMAHPRPVTTQSTARRPGVGHDFPLIASRVSPPQLGTNLQIRICSNRKARLLPDLRYSQSTRCGVPAPWNTLLPSKACPVPQREACRPCRTRRYSQIPSCKAPPDGV